MYHMEEFKNMTTTENYLANYVDVAGFLKYCEACRYYGKIWTCPPYEFNPEEYWKIYKYIYIIGTKVTFDRTAADGETGKEETEKYIRREFYKIKKSLTEKMLALEKKYPSGISLSAGNCSICRSCTRPTGGGLPLSRQAALLHRISRG